MFTYIKIILIFDTYKTTKTKQFKIKQNDKF